MAEYGSHGTRIVTASKLYWCDNDDCRGAIIPGTEYENVREDPRGGRTWQGRRHLDCEAGWWQVKTTHLLSALGALPIRPPSTKFDIAVTGEKFTVRSRGDATTTRLSSWSLPSTLGAMVAHAPKRLSNATLKEIATAEELLHFSLMRVAGDRKAALQVSHLLQQIYQVAQTTQRHPSNL